MLIPIADKQTETLCIIAKLKGEASNHVALSFRMSMYVCISADCAMEFYASVCISATLAQYNPMLAYVCLSRLCNYCTILWPKCAQGQLRPWTTAWPVWPVSYGRTQPQAFLKSLPHSLRIAYDFSDALKTP